MAIKSASEMDFRSKKFTVIIAGAPGLGKTTLALSAPKPLLFDLDHGIARVRAEHRQPTSFVDTYEDMLADMDSDAYRECESVVIDTGGSLVQLLQPWAKKQDPKAARDGRAMFGIVKREFDRLCAEIRTDNKNAVIVFHTTEQQKGDVITQRLSCEGSAKDIVWTPADFGGCMMMQGKRRMIGFSPTEEYFAKGCFGIGGLIEVPELKEGQPNTFLTDLFARASANIAAESVEYTKHKAVYDRTMQAGRSVVSTVKDAESAAKAMESIKAMEHALTSKAELGGLLVAKTKELGLRWDKESGRYVKA